MSDPRDAPAKAEARRVKASQAETVLQQDPFTRSHVLVKRIGEGVEGWCDLWRDQKTGEYVVTKTIIGKTLKPLVNGLPNELYMFRNIPPSPSQIKFLGSAIAKSDRGSSAARLQFEYCNAGSLEDCKNRMDDAGVRVPQSLALHVMIQLLQWLEYAATGAGVNKRGFRRFFHHDLHPGNILVHSESGSLTESLPQMKIADLGNAGFHDEQPQKMSYHLGYDIYYVGGVIATLIHHDKDVSRWKNNSVDGSYRNDLAHSKHKDFLAARFREVRQNKFYDPEFLATALDFAKYDYSTSFDGGVQFIQTRLHKVQKMLALRNLHAPTSLETEWGQVKHLVAPTANPVDCPHRRTLDVHLSLMVPMDVALETVQQQWAAHAALKRMLLYE